jgi:hypothetical protein
MGSGAGRRRRKVLVVVLMEEEGKEEEVVEAGNTDGLPFLPVGRGTERA